MAGEAVDIFQRSAREIAMVLLDMTMPVMGGKEELRLIRQIRPDVPVIVLTGYSEDIVLGEYWCRRVTWLCSEAIFGGKIDCSDSCDLEESAASPGKKFNHVSFRPRL
jgi:CheY-like chemotaxis protein